MPKVNRSSRRWATLLGAAALATALLLLPSPTLADDIPGTPGDDVKVGTGGPDSMSGGDGNDSLAGGNGDDTVQGDAGDDLVEGELGNDIVFGGDGNDFLSGGPGNDRLFGDEGNDTLCAGSVEEVIDGGRGNDIACAHHDTFMAEIGVTQTFDVAANDEVLPGIEDSALLYALEFVPAGVDAAIDGSTGMVTVQLDASFDPTTELIYRAYRDGLFDSIFVLAEVAFTLFVPEAPGPGYAGGSADTDEDADDDSESNRDDDDPDGEESAHDVDAAAALPDTGAPRPLILVTGFTLMLTGLAIGVASSQATFSAGANTPRRRRRQR